MEDFESRFNDTWQEICPNGEDSIEQGHLKAALDLAGHRLPNHQVRDLLAKLKAQSKLDSISRDEFKQICQDLESLTDRWKTGKTITEDEVITHKSEHGYSYHMVLREEQRAFSHWINANLNNMAELKHLLPLTEDGSDLYSKIEDGILLCKLINLVVPDTIDPRAINQGANLSLFKKHENLTLAIHSAQAIGCQVVNMNSQLLFEGRQHIILGLIWQIIARFLFDQITLQNVPGLVALLQEGESVEELMRLSPEQILLRWVNYQLEKAGCDKRVKNFTNDIRDSEAYAQLIQQIAPKEAKVQSKNCLKLSDLKQRAEGVLVEADKIGCREFVTSSDIVNGVDKLNLAFVANLFNKYPGLDEPTDIEELEEIVETREEKMYRNWMNSLGVDPHVNYLYTDLYDGHILFQLYEIIQPGIVNWKRVVKRSQMSKISAKRQIQILENCNYAVELGRKINLVLVNIEGNDIVTGNRTLTLGLVWQLMRKYTLALLSKLSPDGTPIVETEILTWANQRLLDSGKQMQIKHFQDPIHKTALPVIHLIDALRPGTINYDVVKTSATSLSPLDCMNNAKYAITMARMTGAPVYALPEDLTEVKHKMVMTVYAGLMLVDMS